MRIFDNLIMNSINDLTLGTVDFSVDVLAKDRKLLDIASQASLLHCLSTSKECQRSRKLATITSQDQGRVVISHCAWVLNLNASYCTWVVARGVSEQITQSSQAVCAVYRR